MMMKNEEWVMEVDVLTLCSLLASVNKFIHTQQQINPRHMTQSNHSNHNTKRTTDQSESHKISLTRVGPRRRVLLTACLSFVTTVHEFLSIYDL